MTNDIETALTSEVTKLRAVLAEQRALIRKLLSDRDEHVAAMMSAFNAYKNLERAVEKLETVKVPDEVPGKKGFISGLTERIAAAGNGQ